MKRILSIIIALLSLIGISAQQNNQSQRLTDGFYRVQNHGTKRYAYIYDRTGSISLTTTDADMGAIVLYGQTVHDRFSDPASVCYIEKVSHKHNVYGQNTSFNEIIDHYVQIQDAKDSQGADCYRISPIFSGTYIYMRDGSTTGRLPDSYVVGKNNEAETADNFDAFRWDFVPFSSAGDEYLGIAPKANLQIGSKYYHPYVLGFAMSFHSPGMKAYYVTDIRDDAVIIKEYTGEIIPANTPIIVECSSSEAANNRVNLYMDNLPALTDNKLSANYFCYGKHSTSDRLVYDPERMRMLAVRNGKLTYIKDVNHEYTSAISIKNISNYCVPANSSYIKVPSGAPDELSIMTEEEYRIAHGAGDFNGNGTVTREDLNTGLVPMVLRQIPENLSKGDINGDGRVNIVDIAALIRYMLSH